MTILPEAFVVKILVKFILPIILTVMGFLFKKYFKVFNKEAMKFKTIRTEYLKDKTMGYFYLRGCPKRNGQPQLF